MSRPPIKAMMSVKKYCERRLDSNPHCDEGFPLYDVNYPIGCRGNIPADWFEEGSEEWFKEE